MTQNKEFKKPEPQSPSWHKIVLEARLKEFANDETETLTLEELKERLRKK